MQSCQSHRRRLAHSHSCCLADKHDQLTSWSCPGRVSSPPRPGVPSTYSGYGNSSSLISISWLRLCATSPRSSDRLASPAERWGGFGTCGWIDAGRPKSVQPLVAADVMLARVHAVRVRDYDRLRRARLTTLVRHFGTASAPLADSDPP